MVDRVARQELLIAVDDYLSGRIKTFEFQEKLDELDTKDSTVREIVFLMWFHYDDVIDHPVKLSRQQWNFFQRLRLIAQSDAEIQTQRNGVWTPFHSFIVAALSMLLLIVCVFGIGMGFWVSDIVLGIGYLVFMHALRPGQASAEVVKPWELVPFDSFGSMRVVYESTATFQKMPYPRKMDLTPLRTTFQLRLGVLPFVIFWPILSLFQLLAIRCSRYSVVPAITAV